jgi:formylglycine-generating enzyme required for sulfatase activity
LPERAGTAASEAVYRRQGFDPRASTGLFVGVSSFEDERFSTVPFAVDDAVDLAYLFAVELKLLLPKRATLALSGEPQKAETRERLTELLEQGARRIRARQTDIYRGLMKAARASAPEGLFLLTVATHGLTDQGGDFLIARDSLPERMVRTGVAVGELFDDVTKAPAGRRLVLLDACRERLSERTRSLGATAMAASFAEAIARASGQVVLSGATHGGYAYDDETRGNGVFTGAVLDGLRGAASADPQGLITVRTLADYVQAQVAAWVQRHRPDHAEASRGIGQRIEGPAGSLPLAVNPAVFESFERYAQRRAAALTRLGKNLGGVVTGALYDQIVGLLPAERPISQDAVEPLLEEIEALDGTVRGQRSLRDFVRETHGEAPSPPGMPSPSPETPPTAPAPKPEVPARLAMAQERTPSWRPGFLVAGLAILLISVGIWRFGPWGADSGDQNPPILESSPPPPPESPAAGTARPGPLGMDFRFIPPGSYTVGSPENEPGRYDHEWPRHDVQLTRGFWLAETEVTQAQWGALVPQNPSSFKACGKDCPVENVSWFEAATFANLLSEKEGLGECYALQSCTGTLGDDYTCESGRFLGLDCEGYRLPTETEWEVAARAKTTTPIYTGGLTLKGARNAPELDAIAWYGGNSGVEYEGGYDCSTWPEKQFSSERCGSHPVRQKQGNAWELYDMLGNVWEWCTDWYGTYDANVQLEDRTGPVRGSYRVRRGGSWDYYARVVRAAVRLHLAPSLRWHTLGFRLARGQLRSGEAEPRVR